jgi:predicted DNA-binding transcriptional regulator AlpA
MMTVSHDPFIPKSQLREHGLPFSGAHAMRLARAGKFPPPVRLSARKIGWLSSQLSAFLAEKASAA